MVGKPLTEVERLSKQKVLNNWDSICNAWSIATDGLSFDHSKTHISFEGNKITILAPIPSVQATEIGYQFLTHLMQSGMIGTNHVFSTNTFAVQELTESNITTAIPLTEMIEDVNKQKGGIAL